MAPFSTPVSSVPVTTSLLGAFLVLFGLYSAFIKERLYLSEALMATVLGTIVGPHVSGAFVPAEWSGINTVILEVSRVVIAMQIMAAVINLPVQYYRWHWRSIAVLVLPVMTCSWMISTGIIYGIMGIPFVKALMLGASIAPTDPILANSIVKGKFADRHVPRHVRDLLSGESACNDCTAAPFLLLALAIHDHQGHAGEVAKEFFLWVMLWELCLAGVLGLLIGFVARKALRYSHDHDLIDQENFLSFAIALALMTNGVAYLLSMNDFLAVFAAAISFAWDGSFYDETKTSQIQEVLDNLANSFFFIFFGALIPWPKFFAAGMFWRLFGTSALVLAFRRLPMTFLFSRMLPSLKSWIESLFVGHFGPMAVGTVYYLAVIQQHLPDFEEAQVVLSFIVFSSILVHGTTVPMFKIGHAAVRSLSGGSSIRAPRAPSSAFNTNSISAPVLQRPVILPLAPQDSDDTFEMPATPAADSIDGRPSVDHKPPRPSITIVAHDPDSDDIEAQSPLADDAGMGKRSRPSLGQADQ
ncbi:Na+/H+ antiporter [Sorochytrium milnesiophthora]